MRFAFVDESARDENFYFLGAVLVDEVQLAYLHREFQALLQKYSVDFPLINLETELHGSSIMRGAEMPWRRIPKRVCIGIFSDCLRIIEKSGASVFIEGIDISRYHRKTLDNLLSPREQAFRHILYEINGFCARNGINAKIIADNHHTSEVSISNFKRYKEFGLLENRDVTLSNIDHEIVFIPSETSCGLQASDLITYLFNRINTVNEVHHANEVTKQKMWRLILPAVSRPRGGNRIWPESTKPPKSRG